MQRKQHFEHPRLASTKQWTKKNPSLVLSPSHILSSNWSRKTRANTYRELLSCATENISPSPGRSCDGKQMAKNSRRFCIKRIEYMVFLFRNDSVKKCTLAPSQCAPRCLHKKKKKILQTRQNSIICELPHSSSVIDVGFLFHYLSHIPPQWAALNLFASWWLEWVHYPVTSFTEVFSPKVLERQHFYMFTSSIKSPKWTEGNHTSAHFMLLIEKATQSGTNLELNVQTVSFLSLWRFHRHWSKVQGELRKTGQTWPNCDLGKLTVWKPQLLTPTSVCLHMLAIMWLLKP